MTNNLTPFDWATMPNSAFNAEDVFVNEDGVEVSEHIFFQHNRIGLRLETADGRVSIFALSRNAQQALKDVL